LLFIIYIYDLPPTINTLSEPIILLKTQVSDVLLYVLVVERTRNYFQGLKQKVNPKKEYIMRGQKVMGLGVKLNVNHMKLPFYSGVSFQLL
jgi:hypothetical protein